MAKFIERPAEDEDEEFAALEDNTEELEQPQVETPEPSVEATDEEDDIPEKYRGKKFADIVRMHQEAERLVGRQSSEVGELRKIVDDFVKTQLETQKQSPQAQQDDDDVDLFENPDAYIERKLASHPKLKEMEQYTMQAKQSQTAAMLEEKHPNYREIVGQEAFGKWIEASKIRQQLFMKAHQEFDFDSADELLSLWKERQDIVKQTESVQKQDRKNQAKAASTSSAKGSGEPASRKVYRRADIIELMKTNPKRYQQLSDEIMQAYAEGRVK